MKKQIIQEPELAKDTAYVSSTPWSVNVKDFDQEETLYNMKKDDTIHSGIKTQNGFILPTQLNELNDIFKDLLAGDTSVLDTPELSNLNIANMIAAIEWLAKSNTLDDSEKTTLLTEGWRLNFKCKPPTPEEFLTDKYIGAQSESLYPWLKDTFCDFFDPLKPYRTLILGQHIGSGKSVLTTLLQLFISVHYAMMWHPYKYFGLAPSSVFTQCMGGWNQKKASELLIEPFIQILECSPYFKRVRSHTDLVDASAGEIENCLHWTTSTPTAQPLDSKVYLADGSYKLIGDIQIGDKIASPTSGETEVTAIPFEGEADVYEIELEDGRTVRCSDFHLWKVRRSPESEWEVQNLKYIMEHPEFDWEIIEVNLTSGIKIKSIKKVGKCQQKCIHVSNEDGLYITDNHIITHNSVLQFQNGVNYKLITGPGSILGQNIISASISELTMFTENGWTNEQVFTFFTKLRKRIDNRMKGNFYGRFSLDSQPNTLESVIDEWIWSEGTQKNKQNLIVSGSRWKFFPKEFPEAWETPRNDWKEPECLKKDFVHSFPIFKGGNGQPPRVIESPSELTMYNAADVIWAPMKQETSNGIIDMRDNALESPIEFLRDQAGIPSGAADRIFYNPATIEACFDNNLRNMFGQITAPAEEEPEHLIWNQIKDKFFNKIIDKYHFYYEPGIPRAVSVDQSYAGDVTSIAVTHVERDPERKDEVTGEPLKVYVTDMIITIIPKGGIINLDAIRCFIWDLISLGNMRIKHASFDGFMSQPAIQFLKRKGVEVDQLSVDKTNEPYLNYIDYVFHKRWNTGKCIYAKNNMSSIQMVKRKQTGTTKIDHMQGDIVTDGDGNWETDQRGVNAKDALDAVVGSIELINRYDNEFIPFVTWKPYALNDRSYETMKKKQNDFMKKLNFII